MGTKKQTVFLCALRETSVSSVLEPRALLLKASGPSVRPLDLLAAGAAVRPPPRVERAAGGAPVIHRAREPLGDDGADDEDAGDDEEADERVLQALYLSASSP